jgi:two-component system sensor histidine kinase/response regulator
MGSVIGLAEILKENIKDRDYSNIEQYVDLMYNATTNGFKLLENLLEWAKLQIGKTPFEPSYFNLLGLINESAELLKANSSAKEIDIMIQIPLDLQVYADENMISTIMRNLISNAIKFTPKGGKVTIEGKLFENAIQISVTDSGIGIKPENIEKLLNMDLSVSTFGTENEKGSGLGLCLCQEFIKRHNGEISIKSSLGKGTEISFTLPNKT